MNPSQARTLHLPARTGCDEKTLDEIQGAWVKEQKVRWENAAIAEYRVTMKVTFILRE
jgi:flavin-binding protein dodecin